jgi:hypothetical protein
VRPAVAWRGRARLERRLDPCARLCGIDDVVRLQRARDAQCAAALIRRLDERGVELLPRLRRALRRLAVVVVAYGSSR